jgi:lipopolysaccharide transport system permease protein
VRASAVEIRSTRGIGNLGFRELWLYRDLAYFFAWRDVKVRYKQTVFGAAWAIIQPLVLMIVFTFVFGTVLNVKTPPGVPKPVFYYAGLLPWTLFTGALAAASGSLVSNSNLVGRIYFPRLILPLSAVGSNLVDFVIALSFVFVMIFMYGLGVSVEVLWLPLFTLLTLLTALAMGLWLTALHARYRDVQYAVPFLMSILLFLTPVFFPLSQVPPGARALYSLNPMTGVVEGFRWALTDAGSPPGLLMLVSAAIMLLLFVSGLFYFRAAERTIADLI